MVLIATKQGEEVLYVINNNGSKKEMEPIDETKHIDFEENMNNLQDLKIKKGLKQISNKTKISYYDSTQKC